MIIYLSQKRAVKWLCCSLFIFIGGCPDVDITRPSEAGTDSVSLFAKHLHPLIKKYKCGNCHTTMETEETTEPQETQQCRQNPCFAVDDAKAAHDILLSEGKVDLDNPANSIIAIKVGGGHNCPAGTECHVAANNFTSAIEKWKKGLADARAKIIQTDSVDLTGTTTVQKTFYYDLRYLIGGPIPPTSPQDNTGQETSQATQQRSTTTQQNSPAPQRSFSGAGNCPFNINICLEVDVSKPSGRDAYDIKRFEIKTDTDIYVKNVDSLLNGLATTNFNQECAVQSTEFNFIKTGGHTQIQIKDKNARQHMLAFRFEQLRPATENDNSCDGTKQQEPPNQIVVPQNIRGIIATYCTDGCHNGRQGGGRDLNWPADKEISLGRVQDSTRPMPQAGSSQLTSLNANPRHREALIEWLSP